MVKPILLATSREAPWHPWPTYRDAVLALLEADVIETQDWDGTVGPLMISVADEWDRPLSDAAASALTGFVEAGGALLVLHNGISIQARPELARLVGARFIEHPDAGELMFRLTNPTHPSCRGVSERWSLTDEPYRFEFLDQVETLVEYEYEGAVWPAGWTKQHGRGRVVYLMPGHFAASYRHPEYAALVRRAASWLMPS